MTSKSSLISSEDYGDIAWFSLSEEERTNITNKLGLKLWNGVFALFPETSNIQAKSDSVVYCRVVIFPEMKIGNQNYAYESMIGLLPNEQIEFRGTLFDDITPREEIIIGSLFAEFINDSLDSTLNPIEMFRNARLEGKCRAELINELKRVMLYYIKK